MQLAIDTMTMHEKLAVLEQVWDSLRTVPEDLPAPDWHEAVLRDRGDRLRDGKATLSNWEDAKERLDALGR